ncbi:MAG: arsenic metallochaperone ArsD family protein, partial [Candidatus Krumholzibacteria bacterium]|nr:arsenic metallochaperone ArsD family protein [Candidatus Krumholzibacteria bacterium]
MVKLEVYDPPMCCSSGVCCPSVDQVLPRFASDLEWLRNKGMTIA